MSSLEIQDVSWLDRLAGAAIGGILGIVVVGGSVALLWWNESRTVRRSVAISEVERALRHQSAGQDPTTLPNGSIVHLTGALDVEPEDFATDPLLAARS